VGQEPVTVLLERVNAFMKINLLATNSTNVQMELLSTKHVLMD